MAYQPRQFRSVVDVPPVQVPTALRSLVDLAVRSSSPEGKAAKMRVQEMERTQKGEQLTRDVLTRLTDPVTGVPDYKKAAAELRTSGYPDHATQIEQNWQQQRDERWRALSDRVSKHKTIYGQSAEWLRGLEEDPTRYPEVRPFLVEAAGQLSPQLAQNIPEAYDPERVRQMMTFVNQSAQEIDLLERSIKKADDARTRTADRAKQDNLFRESLGTALAGAATPEAWNAIRAGAQFQDFPKGIVDEFAEFSDANRAKARSLAGMRETNETRSIDQLINDADRRGDVKEKTRLLKLKQDLGAAGRAPGRIPTGGGPSQAQRAAAERWKQAQLSALEKRYRDSQARDYDGIPMTEADLKAEKERIQASYVEQLGASGAGPAAEGAPSDGDPVTLTITNPDGSTRTVEFASEADAQAFAQAAGLTLEP